MGFSVNDLRIFDGLLRSGPLKERAQVDVLCLGYQDVIISDVAYDRHFGGIDWRSKLRDRPNREKLLSIHGGDPKLISVVPTLDSFFSLYGNVKVDVIDFAQYEGSEIVHNMGEPISPALVEKYDIVIDGGTTEHVFDIACAFFNCAKLAKVGGYVYHSVPMTMLNHGFYNFNPTLLCDFYEDNGFETSGCIGVINEVSDNPRMFDLPKVDRFRVEGGEAAMLYIAQKKEARDAMIKPIQRKYRDVETWR